MSASCGGNCARINQATATRQIPGLIRELSIESSPPATMRPRRNSGARRSSTRHDLWQRASLPSSSSSSSSSSMKNLQAVCKQDQVASSDGFKTKCSGSFRYKNILANRSVPVLFVLVCFLVIANTNCDNVGSTNVFDEPINQQMLSAETDSNLNDTQNDQDETLSQKQQAAALAMHIKSSTSAPVKGKSHALNVLREIYLDSNSKVTMFSPEDELVQKFHPNGRYGRRSVDSHAEEHNEFGKLVQDDRADSSFSSPPDGRASLGGLLRSIRLSSADGENNNFANRSLRQQLAEALTAAAASRDDEFNQLSSASSADELGGRHQVDSSKLLRCSFSGILNLYKCHSAAMQLAK